jgi:hypothetical protein
MKTVIVGILTSGRKVTLFRTLTVAPSVGLFSKLTTKPTNSIIFFFFRINVPFVLACFQASAAPRPENSDSDEKDALFGLDTKIAITWLDLHINRLAVFFIVY